jgi:hypothetical protein
MMFLLKFAIFDGEWGFLIAPITVSGEGES